jgi:nitroreductase
MDAITAITTRASPLKLGEPGPSPAEVKTLLEAAIRAPDHGKLKPWRFLVIEGAARERLGDLWVEGLRRREPEAQEIMLQREREKPLRAPTIFVVIARVARDHPKIPAVEQIISAGTAAQNLQLAAHAMGYGCLWRTGAAAYDPVVKAGLGVPAEDQIIGFMYVGSIAAAGPLRPLAVEDFAAPWPSAG